MTDDSQENSLIRFGATLKKLKGLWLIGLGLLVIALWLFPFVYIQYALASHEGHPFIVFILDGAYTAFAVLLNPFVWNLVAAAINLVAITGFALLFSGLYCLVCSLLRSQGNEEEEE